MKSSTLLILFAIPLLWSCVDNIDAGPVVSERRNLPEFNELEIDGSFEVVINPDFNFDVRITAPSNLMEYIETYVAGDRLIVRERNNRVDHNRVLIEISENYLNWVELNGSGSITAEDTLFAEDLVAEIDGSGLMDIFIETDDLHLSIDGSGIIEAWGNSPNVTSKIEGSGFITSRSVESTHADARIDGSGSIDIYASEYLFARIGGSGMIRYWGEPDDVDAMVDGSGQIIEIN